MSIDNKNITFGMHMDYSGYINAHLANFWFKNIDEIKNKKLIINLGNDNIEY